MQPSGRLDAGRALDTTAPSPATCCMGDAETMTPMASLADRWGIGPNQVSRRCGFLGIKAHRIGNHRYLDAEQMELAERLHQHLLAGKPQAAFSIDGQPVALVPRQAPEPTGQAAGLAALAQTMAPPVDPLRRARGLADAADAGLVLTSGELSDLGIRGIDGFTDGTKAYGMTFHRHHQRGRVLWTVSRELGHRQAQVAPHALPEPDRPSIGFGAVAVDVRVIEPGVSLFPLC